MELGISKSIVKSIMKKQLTTTFIGLILCISLQTTMAAQEIIELPAIQVDTTIQWEAEESQYYSENWNTQVVTNVSKPSMEVFRPVQGTATGTAVVVCPGGALYGHSIESEGNQVARWLAQRGVTVFVLRYRLVPTQKDATQQVKEDGRLVVPNAKQVLPSAVQDALQAIQHIREHADDYSVQSDRIGIMGFSAGGAVTMGATLNATTISQPNFIAPVYPWTIVLSAYEVPENAPPAFVLCASDDSLDLVNGSVAIYSKWIAAGKSAELHMCANGGHGFGMRTQNLSSDGWIELFWNWLRFQEF